MRFFRYKHNPFPNPLIGQKVHRTQTESMHVLFQLRFCWGWCTVAETNSSPLKTDGWKMNFLLGGSIFRGLIKFREGKLCHFFAGTPIVSSYSFGKRMWQWMSSQQESKQISNFQPVVFVSRIYTNTSPVSLPLILPCGVPRLSWCQPWWGIS